jgi:hypothetical protein
MIKELRDGIDTHMSQPGVHRDEVKGRDIRKARRNAIMSYDQQVAFVQKASEFSEMLDKMLLDPVIRNQIEDHLEFTGEVGIHEADFSYNRREPLIKIYYELTDASMGIALTEYVAIQYLLSH